MEKENLESKVCEIFDKLGVTVTENDIDTSRKLRGHKTIVKFCKRKICQNVLRKKRSLKNCSYVGLSGETPLFINESLCSYYKGLWNKCKELWNEKHIFLLRYQWECQVHFKRRW